jgi:hypothetical protein
MAITFVDYAADPAQTDFLFTFDYLEDEHVVVTVNGVTQTLTTNYTIDLTSTKKIVLSNPTTPLAGGEIVRIRRKSQPDTNLVDFVNGSVLTESELDRAYLHNRYLAEEISELNDASLQKEQGGDNWDAQNKRITNVGTPTASADATTKAYVDGIASAIATGVGLTPDFNKFTGDGTTDTFSLSFTTNGVASSAVLVTINGIVQDPDDYTVAGGADEIQFDTPPANLSEILVIERGYKVATDIPTEYDWGSVATDPVSASYSYGQIV